MIVDERNFLTLEEAASALVIDMVGTLREAISSRGKALMAVSGGKTPRKVFGYLREHSLNWNNITITLTDERWVPNDHPESNEQLLRSYLLKYLSEDPNFVSLYRGYGSLEADIKSCESQLKKLQLPFDAVYLGIGSDGHFASLFPGDKALNVSDSHCVAIAGTNSRLARISLTASTILNARKIYLLFAGEDKHSAYRRAKTPGPNNEIPLRLVLSQVDIPVVVYCAP